MDPNKGNGGQTDKYSWTQTLKEVSVVFSVSPGGVTKKNVQVDFGRSSLKVVINGEVYASGELYGPVSPEDCFWQLDSADGTVTLFLEKTTHDEWWKCLVKGDAEIDVSKVQPENSKLEDLDAESRSMVEKMMVEQREKAMRERGLLPNMPAGMSAEQAEMLRKFQKQNPDMDLSGAKFT
uniref:CS domain-containing protein n=1 Tax=Erythrolobus australicus TaxID=1077150 RepID=A0A7S1TK81_9RHOD|mmetsp:Transcript_1509/g.4016  ORF Transcript_1509/g.4016 Transcript_1509/m.4016 type:complete len:180 (+) Transcript_1509:88-627(+)